MSTNYATGAKLVSVPLAGGASVEVPMLSPAGFVEIAQRLQDRRRDQLRDNLRDAGCDPKLMLQHMNTINATPVRLQDIVFPVANDGWLQAVVVEIGMREYPGAKVNVLKLPDIAAGLLGLELVTESEKSDGATPFFVSPTGQNPSASFIGKPDESEPPTA